MNAPSRILDREKYLARDLTKIDMCFALLRGRPPGGVVCISGNFYRYRLEGCEGSTGAVIKVYVAPFDTTPSKEGEERKEELKEFLVPVPGLYGYGVRFLAITNTHLLLQTYSDTITGATATVLFDLAR